MKLNIGTKVNLLIIVALVLVGGASVLLSVASLKKEGEISIQTYSVAIMGEKKALGKGWERVFLASGYKWRHGSPPHQAFFEREKSYGDERSRRQAFFQRDGRYRQTGRSRLCG